MRRYPAGEKDYTDAVLDDLREERGASEKPQSDAELYPLLQEASGPDELWSSTFLGSRFAWLFDWSDWGKTRSAAHLAKPAGDDRGSATSGPVIVSNKHDVPPGETGMITSSGSAGGTKVEVDHGASLASGGVFASDDDELVESRLESALNPRNSGETESVSDSPTSDGERSGLDMAADDGSGPAAAPAGPNAVSVSTDKQDYAPGETATITVTGAAQGGTVYFEVDHVTGPGEDGIFGTNDDERTELGGSGHDPWSVTDGGTGDLDGVADGSITASWYVNPDDSAGKTFLLTVTDPGPDGELGRGPDTLLASTSFTDPTGFIEKTLTRADGQEISNITHMEFGPDGLLYASSLVGTIYAFDITKTLEGEYVATLVYELDQLLDISNHNDNGSFASGVAGRFVMGFDVVGTASNPVIFVTSSDPRIGAVTSDTNSGILSMLQQDANGDWQKIDLIRGLPRSQHDHLVNDVEYFVDESNKPSLLISVGGNTNAGAPSSPLNWTPEYVLSGSVLKVDLNAITSMAIKTDVYGNEYYYNMPTLDDPTRSGVNEGADPSIAVFGGNGGLNQAIYDPTGPVTFYSTGLRNAVEILQTEGGTFLTFDNGGNPSWGGTVVLETVNGELIATNQPEQGDQPTSNIDQLHVLSPGGTFGTYLGHPNAFRASGADAGLYVRDGSGALLPLLPTDFESLIPADLEDIDQAFFLAEGSADGAIAVSSKSTNGIAEYTYDGAFGGAIAGNIFAVRYGTQSMIRIELTDVDNDGVPDSGVVAEQYPLGVGGPIDVFAPQSGDPFFGTLFVSGLVSSGSIRILEPSDGSTGIDLTDRDGDGVHDAQDAFQYDPSNGQTTILGTGQTLFWEFESTTLEEDLPGGTAGYRVGITGFMTNGSDLPEALSLDRFAPVAQGGDDVVLGGTANTILIGATPDGTAEGSADNQYHGFQAGFVPQSDAFTLTVETWNPFRSIPVGERSEQQKTGAALTSGSQDSFLALMIGKGYIELVYEENGVEVARIRQTNASLENVDLTTYLTDLIFDVNVVTGQVVARYEAQTLEGLVVGEFAPVQLVGDLLDAVQGEYSIGGESSALAWALLSTSGTGATFESNWGSVTLEGTDVPAATGAAHVTVDGTSTVNGGAFKVTNTGTQDITRLVLTLDDTFVDDIFWDTDGTGDAGTPKPFTVNSAGGTGVTNASGVTVNPLPGGGYATLVIDFPDFNPGETMTFSIDVDPVTAAGFGSGSPQGAISGLEISGTIVTASFADGTSATGDLVGTGLISSVANVQAGLASAVDLTVGGLTNGESGFVTDPQQTLELSGDPGARVAVLIGAGDTLPDDASGNGLLFPTDFNSIEALEIRYVTLDSSGSATTTINVVDPDPNDPNDGIVKVMAAVVDSNGQPIGRLGAGISLAIGTTGGQNLDPIAQNDAHSLSADDVKTGNVVSNDSDPNGDPLTVSKVNGSGAAVGATITLASGALATVNANGTFSYDPNGQFDGLGWGESATDTLTYEVADGRGGTDTATVTFTIDGVDRDAVVAAVNVGVGTYTSVETGISYAANPGPIAGTIKYRNKSGDQIFGTEDDPLYQTYGYGDFEYGFALPNGNYIVQLELVEPWWTLPGQRLFDVAFEGAVQPGFDNVDVFALAGGTWQALTMTSAAISVADGMLNIDFNTVADQSIVSAIAVYAVDGPSPDFLTDDAATVDEDLTVLIDVLANDDAGVTLQSVGQPANGSAVIENGQIRYTPDPDFEGVDSFDYFGVEGGGGSGSATVTVNVNPVNDAPENLALSGNTVSEEVSAGFVIGNLSAFDPDGDTILFTVDDPRFAVNGASQLVVANGADLSVNQDTDVPVVITATDGNGGSATLNETVTILDGPVENTVVAAINVGGNAYSSLASGIDYAANPGPIAGTIKYRNKSGDAISGTEDDPLYQTYGFGDFEYGINLPNGDYVVQLELVEPWWTTAGKRLFDVALEGVVQPEFNDIDVFSLAGGTWQALTLTSGPVTVADGMLNIDFNTLADQSIVSAISVLEADTLI